MKIEGLNPGDRVADTPARIVDGERRVVLTMTPRHARYLAELVGADLTRRRGEFIPPEGDDLFPALAHLMGTS